MARSSRLPSGTYSRGCSAKTPDKCKGGNKQMGAEIKEDGPRLACLMRRIKELLGAGVYLLLLGLLLEGLAVVVGQWASFPISLSSDVQILLTALCVAVCLSGAIWFNRSLDLIKVHLLDGKKELVTTGPFAYVRHPLYSTLIIAIPPLAVVWCLDLLFFVPWFLILVLSHPLVCLEERGLVAAFGQDYESYRRYVPALLPYKGPGGRRYRQKR
jgi:protein-S-isoprenylcysteine O-methyltransferase Ste14